MTTTKTKWTTAMPADAERMSRNGTRTVYCADVVNGFARPMRAGETLAEAVADFEAAGESVVTSRVYESGEQAE